MSELKDLMLRTPRWTLAVAESITCGRVQARVGLISGASEFFLGGITAYTLDQKVRHLGVDRAVAAACDCVSAEVAEQMACGVGAMFGSDFGLATTGYAEPSAPRGVVQPFAWWALAEDLHNGQMAVRSGRVDCPGASRAVAQEMVADAATAALVAYLRERRA